MIDTIITAAIVGSAFFFAGYKVVRHFLMVKNNPNKCAECQGCILKSSINKQKQNSIKVP